MGGIRERRCIGMAGWLALLWFCAGSAQAAETRALSPPQVATMKIDSDLSKIQFSIGLLLFFNAEGLFQTVQGSIDLDHEQIVVHARIPVVSASMHSARYERLLEGPDFLDGQEHPYIEFTSDPIKRSTLQQQTDVPGLLCMRGRCLQEVFQLLEVDCDDVAGQHRCLMSVSGSLQRSRYGMKTHRGALRNRIELQMHLIARSDAG